MNKLEQLRAAIESLPDQYTIVRNVMRGLLDQMALGELRSYSLGLRDMAVHLTGDEDLLEPLRRVREALR